MRTRTAPSKDCVRDLKQTVLSAICTTVGYLEYNKPIKYLT